MRAPGALPELLCPAGSPEALRAAVESGADAVYFGGPAFHARMRAPGFDEAAMREGIALCHAFGARAYITLNTLCRDMELPAFLRTAELAWRTGADALIVADLGGAALLHRFFPEFELHASTQMSVHSLGGAEMLRSLGFSRIVLARETPARDIRRFVRESGVETEVFVHGALCVSHSGQCLFSSLVGGRSGNRGECAQPCRLPYGERGASYPLSLKDLSLAAHVPELAALGVASFKIEGRMKSPEYVFETAATFRRLIDENRGATETEMSRLAQAFSRGGFTDGYYSGRIGRGMLGVRSENDKAMSRDVIPFGGLTSRVPLKLRFQMRAGVPVMLSLSDGVRTVTVEGDIPETARTAPMTEEAVLRSLCKMGNTPYAVKNATADVEAGLMLPVSRLNELRRRATEALLDAAQPPVREELPERRQIPVVRRVSMRSASFYRPEQISSSARSYFDRIYLPLFSHTPLANGVLLPPVIFDSAREAVLERLIQAKNAGAKWALVGNAGHLDLVRQSGLCPVGDLRLNVTNAESAAFWEQQGVEQCILSPELTLPQLRDVGGNTAIIVYGRLPLMVTEKCVSREIADCRACNAGEAVLTDRKGIRFPVLREWEHRSLIVNSLPTCMSDRQESLTRAGLTAWHFLFTVETLEETDRVIHAFCERQPVLGTVRRIQT